MKKILFILSFFVCLLSQGQFTLINAVFNPNDNGTNATSPYTPPSVPTNTKGDLIIIYCSKRTASGAITISNSSGETWNAIGDRNSTVGVLSGNLFWTQTTQTASNALVNLAVTFNASTNNSVNFLQFRPTTATNSIALDANAANALVDMASGLTTTLTGWTPANDKNVSICIYNTDDDNTWGTPSAGWTQITSPASQSRNLAGSDQSSAYTYQLQTTKAATGNSALTESINGADGGISGRFTWYEFTPAAHDKKQDFFKLFSFKIKCKSLNTIP
jgi:hypothetical protein